MINARFFNAHIINVNFSVNLARSLLGFSVMSQAPTTTNPIPLSQDTFTVGSRTFSSRLLVGTGKYKDMTETGAAIGASEAEIVTVAIRRTNIGQNSDEPNLLDVISPDKYTILPNTAGCFDAETAVRTCKLARELLGGHNLVKLEVLGDEKTLYPNVMETLKAAKALIDDGFEVMVYTSDDPIVAQELESMGCVAIMPLGSLIGSGLGLLNRHTLSLIVENAKVPVLVDAGVGTASDAAIAMELGCDGVLMNSAIANAKDPVMMAHAMKHAVWAGRQAFLAGRMPMRKMATASSPQTGYFFQ
ncbi:MAG: thiazole synthase [Psychrobacter okhotskensis]